MTAASLRDGTSHSPQMAGTSQSTENKGIMEKKGYSFGEMRFLKLA